MSSTTTEIAGKRVSHSRAAEMRDVSGRTLDRWVRAGLLPQPEKINNRKYHLLTDLERVAQTNSAAAA
jgi:DNA-binding transcriptional MerR regulator